MSQPEIVRPSPRRHVAASEALLGVLVLPAAGVGAYALANPNGIEFGAPWPAMAEGLAAVAAAVLGSGIVAGRRGEGKGLRLHGAILAVAALLALAFVAFALSFNQS